MMTIGISEEAVQEHVYNGYSVRLWNGCNDSFRACGGRSRYGFGIVGVSEEVEAMRWLRRLLQARQEQRIHRYLRELALQRIAEGRWEVPPDFLKKSS